MFVFVDEGFILINLELTSSRVYLEVSISISVSGTIDTIAIDLEDLLESEVSGYRKYSYVSLLSST